MGVGEGGEAACMDVWNVKVISLQSLHFSPQDQSSSMSLLASMAVRGEKDSSTNLLLPYFPPLVPSPLTRRFIH